MTNITPNSFSIDYIRNQGDKDVGQKQIDMWTEKLTTGYGNEEGLGFDEELINELMRMIDEHDLTYEEVAGLLTETLDADGDGKIGAEDAEALKTIEDENGDGFKTANETASGNLEHIETSRYSASTMGRIPDPMGG